MCTGFEKTQNFVRKYSLRVELLIFKYRRQNLSVSVTLVRAEVTFADRPMLLPILRVRPWYCSPVKHQTSSLQLSGQPTVLTLVQYTAGSGVSCRSVCTTARFTTSTSWSRVWSKSGNIFNKMINWSSMKQSGSVRQWRSRLSSSLHLSTWRIFWTDSDFCTPQSHV